MTTERKFLILQSIICVLTVFALAIAAIGIYRDGKARQAEDPTAYIYTPEEASSAAAPGVRLLFAGAGLTIAGWLLGIKDENADKPSKMKITYEIKRNKVEHKEERLKKTRLVVLALAVIFIIAGIANGNMHAVLVKAINICTECVGLG